jgi:hypothetical protein
LSLGHVVSSDPDRDLVFDHVRVAASHRLLVPRTPTSTRGFDRNSVGIALACLGVTFGRRLRRFEGVSFPIAGAFSTLTYGYPDERASSSGRDRRRHGGDHEGDRGRELMGRDGPRRPPASERLEGEPGSPSSCRRARSLFGLALVVPGVDLRDPLVALLEGLLGRPVFDQDALDHLRHDLGVRVVSRVPGSSSHPGAGWRRSGASWDNHLATITRRQRITGE